MSARQKPRRLPPFSGVLVLVMASTGLVVVDLTIVAIGLPLISADIADGASAESVVVTYMVAMGALTQIVGSLSDRWGGGPSSSPESACSPCRRWPRPRRRTCCG